MFSGLVKIMLQETDHPGKIDAAEKLSPVETIKATSNYLQGHIAEDLADPTDHVSKPSTQLLKHHGTYQQDDRERRGEARAPGRGRRQSQVL